MNLGWTALHAAAYRGVPEIVSALVDAGAKLDARNNEKMTPLYLACGFGRIDAAKVLLEAGADADLPDKDGKRPRDIAGSTSIKDLLSLYQTRRPQAPHGNTREQRHSFDDLSGLSGAGLRATREVLADSWRSLPKETLSGRPVQSKLNLSRLQLQGFDLAGLSEQQRNILAMLGGGAPPIMMRPGMARALAGVPLKHTQLGPTPEDREVMWWPEDEAEHDGHGWA
eukprot:jgi/Mesvir1/13387/Mv16481-RA.1